MKRAIWCGALVCCAACHSQKLSVIESALAFSSPDEPAELTQPDGGLIQIAFGQVTVGAAKTLTLDAVSVGSPITIRSVAAIQSDLEFGLPFVPGAVVGASPSAITVVFAPISPGQKSAQFLLTYDDPTGTGTALFELSGEGAVDVLSVTPNPVDFGLVEIIQSQPLTLTLSNISQIAATLVVPSLTGADAASFSLGAPSKTMLAPGDSATLVASFQPSAPGPATASFTFKLGPGTLPVTVDLGGIGVSTWLEVQRALDFGFVPLGDTVVKPASFKNLSKYRTLHAIQPAPATFQASGNAFKVGSQEPAIPAELPPGQSLEIPVSFAPTALDAYSGTLFLVTDDPLAQHPAVPLQGYGGGPHILCQPELSFGPVALGLSASMDSFCFNAGPTIPSHPELFLQIAQSDLHTGNPAFVPNLVLPDGGLASAGYSVQLYSGELAKIRVGFQPADAGTFDDWLTVVTNDIEELDAGLLLAGAGVALGPCNLSFVPQALDFGAVPAGSLGILRLEVDNRGADLCFLQSVELDPASDPAYWLPDGPMGPQVLTFPGDAQHPTLSSSLTFDVAFSPESAEATATGSVDVASIVGSVPQSVALTASSQPCLRVNPPNLDFGAVGLSSTTQQICEAADAGFILHNGCGTAVTVSQLALDPGRDAVPQFALQSALQLPLTLAPGGQASFQVGYIPTVPRRSVEALSIAADALPSGPLRVTLQGQPELTGSHTDSFTVPVFSNQVDVLWVLDDATFDLQTLKMNYVLPKLLDAMDQNQLDYKMAVTSTDTCNAASSDQGAFEPCDHCLSNAGSSPEFITSTTANTAQSLSFLLAAFGASPPPNPCGSLNGNQHYFDAIADAFSFPLLSGHNSGFLRNGAYLAIIVMSGGSADDGAGAPTAGPYATSLAQAVSAVQSVKADPQMVSVSYVNSGAGSVGTDQRIGRLVADTGGIEIDTSAPTAEWQASFLDLFPALEGNRFHLSTELGTVGNFEVEVNGVATKQWILDRTRNDLVFSYFALPPEGATVSVTYDVGCP